MGAPAQPLFDNLSFEAGEALAIHRCVKLSAATVVYADAEDDFIGVTQNAPASGSMATVRPKSSVGTQYLTASEAITANNPVYAADDGKIAASGTRFVGVALEAATADGDEIEVMIFPTGVQIVQAGIHTWAGGAATTDSISVVGLVSTDIVLATLVARNSTEVLAMAANDAGNDQIDLTLSANGTDGTTKIAYAVLRLTGA